MSWGIREMGRRKLMRECGDAEIVERQRKPCLRSLDAGERELQWRGERARESGRHEDFSEILVRVCYRARVEKGKSVSAIESTVRSSRGDASPLTALSSPVVPCWTAVD
jgi:hypothetical protein